MLHTQAALRERSDADKMVPKILVRAMFGLVVATLAIATYARVTDRPLVATPPVSEIVAKRALHLTSAGSTGAVAVRDGQGALIAELSPEQGGFIAGVHRVILRERAKRGLPPEGAVILSRARNGRLAIRDPKTGWSADLMGFGADNARAFARLLGKPQ